LMGDWGKMMSRCCCWRAWHRRRRKAIVVGKRIRRPLRT
jgi:hypothetical protein